MGRFLSIWQLWLCSCLPLLAAHGAHRNRGFELDIRQYETADQLSPPPEHPVLFTGSSSIQFWATLEKEFRRMPVLNRGVGGTHYSDVADHYDRLISRYQPAAVILYAGDNDIADGVTVTAAFADMTNLVTRIQRDFPQCQVGVISIKPSPGRIGYLAEQQKFNGLAKSFSEEGERRHYIDVHTAMLGSDGKPRAGLFGPDQIHMNRTGYALWGSIIRQELSQWGPYPVYQPEDKPVAWAICGVIVVGGLTWWGWQRRGRKVSSP